MKQWRCRACGKVFQDQGQGAPEGHGDFYITQDGWKQDKCNGTLELLSDQCEDHKCPICGNPIIVIDKRTYYAYKDGTPIPPLGLLKCQECNKSEKVD